MVTFPIPPFHATEVPRSEKTVSIPNVEYNVATSLGVNVR